MLFASLTLGASSRTVASDLVLSLGVDGTVFLYNRSGSAVAFDEYRLVGDGTRFDPAAWTSIADAAAGGQSSVVLAALGPGALTFAETSAEPNHLAEGSANGFATLQPGAWIAIGKPLIDLFPWQGKQFFYHVVGEPTDSEGEIGFYHVPEPTSGMLLLAGAAALAWPLRSAGRVRRGVDRGHARPQPVEINVRAAAVKIMRTICSLLPAQAQLPLAFCVAPCDAAIRNCGRSHRRRPALSVARRNREFARHIPCKLGRSASDCPQSAALVQRHSEKFGFPDRY